MPSHSAGHDGLKLSDHGERRPQRGPVSAEQAEPRVASIP